MTIDELKAWYQVTLEDNLFVIRREGQPYALWTVSPGKLGKPVDETGDLETREMRLFTVEE
jgi:hypothetical protein